MNFKEFYEQVSWTVKQEKSSGPYSLAEIGDVRNLYNRLVKALVASYPQRFRKISSLDPAIVATDEQTFSDALTIFAIKINESNWTIPMSYNSQDGSGNVYMLSENSLKFDPALSVGDVLWLDWTEYPDEVEEDATFPDTVFVPPADSPYLDELTMPPEALEVLIHQCVEQTFIRNGNTPPEPFYISYRQAMSLFLNKRPTFRQQSFHLGGTPPKFGRR